jgi:two-component system, NtrC family, nitrogen regulation sensor histidine kinase NtrY
MARPLAPRGRVLPDLASVIVVYVLIAVGCGVFAGEVLSGEPDFPSLYERLPIALLALLPAALIVAFAIKARALALDLRARRYGSRLRLRLSLLFLLAVATASIPQGAFLLRLASAAQASSSSRAVRKALSAGQDLALAWYDEELSRLDRAAARVSAVEGEPRAARLLGELAAQDPRMEAVQVFRGGDGADFAGPSSARLASAPAAPAAGAYGHLLPVSAGGGASLLRYAAPMRGGRAFAVLSLRLPEGLEGTASLLGDAARTASLLEGFSARWTTLLAILYGFLALPLLLVAVILGMTASDLVAEPLASLDEATRRVAAGNFGVRLIVKPADETGRLVASFNRMLAEIERSRVDDVRRGKIDAWKDIAQRLAHELKNPLTPIRLAAERVLRKWRSDPAEAAPIVEGSMLAIIKEVEGMDALLGDFRSFASLPEPQRDWVGLRELVLDSTALYAASYPGVSFGLEGLPEGMRLRVDRASMKRALCNLIANSIDAMNGAGSIEIGADLVKAADSSYCRLRIRDTGRGVSPEIGDRIFVPYFTTKESGTGLGLSIVERIVSEHGGSIRFESGEGVGTTFFVDLPLDR